MDQGAYDANCPPKFQSMEFAYEHGQVDIVADATPAALEKAAGEVISVLMPQPLEMSKIPKPQPKMAEPNDKPDYLNARAQDRFDADDLIKEIFDGFIELGGDGKVGLCKCLRAGLGWIGDLRVMVLKCSRGHTPSEQKV